MYLDTLADADVPIQFWAGRADHVATPDAVYAYYDALGTDDKMFIVASEANGFAGDYGHLDFGPSDHAATDVFPRILAWFEEH